MHRFSYTAQMTQEFNAAALDVKGLAEAGGELSGVSALGEHARLIAETEGRGADAPLTWSVVGELRNPHHVQPEIWMHLRARAVLPLTCQRCLTPADMAVVIERDFRFVADEAVAQAEDEAADEDVLVISRSFDLPSLIEDEFLMQMPLVPLHETCPQPVQLSAVDPGFEAESPRAHPFAVLAKLRGGRQ